LTWSSLGFETCSGVARLVSGYGILITAGLAFLFVAVVADGRSGARRRWPASPTSWLAPLWLRLVLVSLVVAAATAFLTATLRSTSRGAHGVLARLADDGVLDEGGGRCTTGSVRRGGASTRRRRAGGHRVDFRRRDVVAGARVCRRRR
jgi:hypothetical protein